MIQMQKFYSELQQSSANMQEGHRRLSKIREASLQDVLIVRSEMAWESWPAE